MKKLCCLLMLCLLLVSVSACGKEVAAAAPSQESAPGASVSNSVVNAGTDKSNSPEALADECMQLLEEKDYSGLLDKTLPGIKSAIQSTLREHFPEYANNYQMWGSSDFWETVYDAVYESGELREDFTDTNLIALEHLESFVDQADLYEDEDITAAQRTGYEEYSFSSLEALYADVYDSSTASAFINDTGMKNKPVTVRVYDYLVGYTDTDVINDAIRVIGTEALDMDWSSHANISLIEYDGNWYMLGWDF